MQTNKKEPDQGKVLLEWVKSSKRLPNFSNKEIVYREKDGNMFVIFINVKEDLKADDYFYEWLEETTIPSQPVKEEDKESVPLSCKHRVPFSYDCEYCRENIEPYNCKHGIDSQLGCPECDKESVLTDEKELQANLYLQKCLIRKVDL